MLILSREGNNADRLAPDYPTRERLPTLIASNTERASRFVR